MRHVSARSSADIPVVTESSLESIVTVYAVHFGSAFSVTICGSARRVATSGVMGAHIRPLCFGIVSNVAQRWHWDWRIRLCGCVVAGRDGGLRLL